MPRLSRWCFFRASILFLSLLSCAGQTPVWTFQGNSTSGYTVANAPGISYGPDNCGVPNNAMTLSGGAYLTFAGSTSGIPSGSSPRTVIAWLRCSSQSNSFSGNVYGIVLKFGNAAVAQQTALVVTSTYAFFSSYGNDCNSLFTVCDGTWHHVALIYSNPTFSVYVDGVLVKQCTLAAMNTPISPLLYIGWNGNLGAAGGERWQGTFSNLRIYNTALSAPFVVADVSAGCAVARPMPVWTFAGYSTSDFSVVNPSGVTFGPDNCSVPGTAITLSGGAYMTFAGSTAALPSGNAARAMVTWIKCSSTSTALSGSTYGYVLRFGNYGAGLQTAFVITTSFAYWSAFAADLSSNFVVCDGRFRKCLDVS